jgi:hypothetical protein
VEIMEVWVLTCGIGTACAGYAGMYKMGSEVTMYQWLQFCATLHRTSLPW